MAADNETNVTEIELMSDGRIFIFGASFEVLSLLDDLGLSDEALRSRLRRVEGGRRQERDTIRSEVRAYENQRSGFK